MSEQSGHGDEACDGKDVDGSGCFFADVDFLVSYMIAYREGLCKDLSVRDEERGPKEGLTVAIPIQPGRRRRGSLKPPARVRTVDVT
jgi:hypothetical protein